MLNLTEFLNKKNKGRKIKMFVAQIYCDRKRSDTRKDHIWRAYFDKISFPYFVQDSWIKEDYVEIVSINQHDREFRLQLKYKDEVFEHYEPFYSLDARNIFLDDGGKIIAHTFIQWNYNEDKPKYIWKELLNKNH
jgi:hypothetical protein